MKKKRKLRIQDNEPKDKILQSWEKFEEKYGIREIKDDKTENFDENSEENTVSSESSDIEKSEEISDETEEQNNDNKFLFKRNTESEYSKKKKRATWWTIIFVVLSILKFCNSQNDKEIMDRYSQQQEKYEKNQENDELKIEILRDNNDCFALNLEVTEGYYIWLKQIFKDNIKNVEIKNYEKESKRRKKFSFKKNYNSFSHFVYVYSMRSGIYGSGRKK